MPYTNNKNMPKIRRDAVRLYKRGWSARKVGRHLGFDHTAVMEWVRRAEKLGDHPIPTRSSRPRTSPNALGKEKVDSIVSKRLEHNRCAEAIHHELMQTGITVSLSSVKRTLDRKYLTKKRSPWKRYHPHVDRPKALLSGDLVELDTIHLMIDKKVRIYVYTLIDVYSRWIYAKSYSKISSKRSLLFVQEAQRHSPFPFRMLQSDHGPEFGRWFIDRIKKDHRYTRIGKPNDNAHIERFNRTLQEECLDKILVDVKIINKELKVYMRYYNCERVHAGINYQIPMQVV
jgi:transposase InsO family protein